jgi:hypothetical protein
MIRILQVPSGDGPPRGQHEGGAYPFSPLRYHHGETNSLARPNNIIAFPAPPLAGIAKLAAWLKRAARHLLWGGR